ncbi:peptidase [Paenibacillus frigoriresistens]|uniref:peptidase n=1 Tax=Paenibacillus alginolyticus TaxID=59839 RepID=UPI001565F7ED|nr:peptidase [Paenibacillus frigoriresistens]NRF90534.1 peptidase [Paenibacillus frigoriresistens]
MKKIILNKITVNQNRVDYFFTIEGNLQKYFNKSNHMFLEYNYEISQVPHAILAIPFVANVMPLMWITDSVLIVDVLDKSFYECLKNVKTAYQNMFPNVEFKGKLVVDKIEDHTYTPEHEAASLFSGGLDAVTTFIRVKDKNPLLITEYGWHGDEIQENEVWNADKENAISFAEQYGLENILIQSNYGTFIHAQSIDYDYHKKLGDSWWHGLHHGLAIISAAIPVAFKLRIQCIYIASSNSPQFQVACASDPTVDNHIRYASGMVNHDAYELTRQDKVKVVVDYYSITKEPVQLRVCFKNKENCCNCEKCLRTILSIVAEGRDPRALGFNVPDDLSLHLKLFLDREVKFFTHTFIEIYWKIIQSKMRENQDNIFYKELLEWFMDYNFAEERKKALFKYRVTQFVPIINRRIKTKINRIFANSQ